HYTDDRTEVYVASSLDGGKTFKNLKVSAKPFTPNTLVFFGDYNHISAHNGVVRPIWTRLDQGALSVWTALMDFGKK
ncbi:MAG: glycosyl hydrolase, partial [Saprospiraceae bacterium]|nr:glycosyl hydrolase [Saprospiraceae bacterium]